MAEAFEQMRREEILLHLMRCDDQIVAEYLSAAGHILAVRRDCTPADVYDEAFKGVDVDAWDRTGREAFTTLQERARA